MAEPVAVGDSDFSAVVLKDEKPFLVDFWAPWCQPCLAMAPIIEQLADEYEGRVGFAKVNVDDNPKVATEYGIQSIPTLLVFKDGKQMSQAVGLTPKPELRKHLDAVAG